MSTTNQLLLIEDDLSLAQLTKSFLEKNNFFVIHAEFGKVGLELCSSNSFDLILCDIMLPDVSGFDLIKKIKQETETPILFLTALNADEDQIKGFELGAIDYIVKPVHPNILLARVNNIIHQYSKKVTSPQIIIEDLVLDKVSGYCTLNDNKLDLTQAEFSLLWHLAIKIGQPVSRDILFKETVGRDYDGMDRTIDGRVSRLRKKLETVERSNFTIKTVWAQGYLLCQKVY